MEEDTSKLGTPDK